MIRHIVMWKVDESYSQSEKEEFTNTFTTKLLDLEGKIDELKTISVNSNSDKAPDTNFDIVLDTTFTSIEDLKAYAVHPTHMKVVEYAKQFKLQRSCVDYEY